jgi:hypothetical protein
VALDDALHKRRFKAGVPGLGQDVPEIVLVLASAAHREGSGDFVRIRRLVFRQLPEPVVEQLFTMPMPSQVTPADRRANPLYIGFKKFACGPAILIVA